MLYQSKINGHNNMYIVLFGTDAYYPDLHLHNIPNQHQFSSIKDARSFAAEYSNAAIFKLHIVDGDDLPHITRVWR